MLILVVTSLIHKASIHSRLCSSPL